MPVSKSKNLSSLLRSAIKKTTTTTTSALTTPAEDATRKHFVSSLDTSSPPSISTSSETILKRSNKSPKPPFRSKKSSPKPITDVAFPSLNSYAAASDDSEKQLWEEISSILCGGTELDSVSRPDLQGENDEKSFDKILGIPWFSSMSPNISLRRKELSRDRKQKWLFKSTQVHLFGRLVRTCAQKLGTDATIQVFGKLGRETGVKEYNTLIRICMEEARRSEDDEVSLQQIDKAFQLFKSMKEQGFQLEEETYGPFLTYLIDMGMIEEFQFFYGVIKDENPS